MQLNKVFLYPVIFLILCNIKASIYFRPLDKVLNNIKLKSIIFSVFRKFNNLQFRELTYTISQNFNFFDCLTCSIFIRKLFHSYEEVRLKIGVKKEGKDLKSHAWIEVNNEVVFGYRSNLSSYRTIHEL